MGTKTIERFYKGGMLQKVPKKLQAKLEVFEEVSKLFESNKKYKEIDVNDILRRVFSDYAMLRRYLVDFKYLVRTENGSEYTLAEKKEEK